MKVFQKYILYTHAIVTFWSEKHRDFGKDRKHVGSEAEPADRESWLPVSCYWWEPPSCYGKTTAQSQCNWCCVLLTRCMMIKKTNKKPKTWRQVPFLAAANTRHLRGMTEVPWRKENWNSTTNSHNLYKYEIHLFACVVSQALNYSTIKFISSLLQDFQARKGERGSHVRTADEHTTRVKKKYFLFHHFSHSCVSIPTV